MQTQIEEVLGPLSIVAKSTLLYDVVLIYTSEHVSPEHNNYLNIICTQIIACLVAFLKHNTQGLLYVEQTFNATPLHRPAFTNADRDAIVHVLHGTHRDAVRLFLTAVSNRFTDRDLCAALEQCLQKKEIHVPIEKDYYARYAENEEPNVRGREIETFLAFRRDLPPGVQMPMLWEICEKHGQLDYFQRICSECINPFLIQCVEKLPDGLDILKRRAFQKHGISMQHQPPPQGPTWEDVLDHFDANHDGTISQIEAIKALRNPLYEQDAIRIGFEPGSFTQESEGRNKFTYTFAEIDSDNDSGINASELQHRFLTYKP